MYKIFALAAFFTFFSFFLQAQHTLVLNNEDHYYELGLELFQKEKYAAAREAFEEYISQSDDQLKTVDAQYYVAYSALRLYNTDGEKLLNTFVESNESHPKAILAYYELGNFYFREKNYKKAIQYFEKSNLDKLTKNQKLEAQFKLAYSHFAFKEFDQALPYFDLIKRQENQYSAAASYYAGYIEYIQADYDKALYDLERAEKNQAYATMIPYLKANVYYKQQRYDELLQYAQQVLNRNDVKNKEGISLLVGEAFYMKGDYQNAADFLQRYADDISKSISPDISYKLAYSQYKTQSYEAAVDNFKKVAMVPDTVGQYASYYLGVLYLNQDNKLYAATAFERAKADDFDPMIKQEAMYNHAKVSYDLGKYAEAIASLKDFTSLYPGSDHLDEARQLISQAYLKTTNYDLAIEYIESLERKSESISRVYQKVTFYKATQLFNSEKFYDAVQMFNKSVQFPYDKDLLIQAHYWAGETYSVGKKYEEAINAYAAVFRQAEPSNEFHLRSRYGIGYAYFNTRQYDKALPHFREYTNRLQSSQNKMFYNDALMRLADCYYVNKVYNSALNIYDQAIQQDHPESDYAFYQKGVIMSIQSKYATAKENLNRVINQYKRSRYRDDAIFELAQLDFEQGNYEVAISEFTSLIRQYPTSEYAPYAYLRRAIANYNLKNYEQSIADYKAVLDKFITHDIANSALLGLQEALTLTGNSDDLDPYLTSYKQANPENENLKAIEFEAAKTLYFNQKYEKAIEAFQKYIEEYPATELAYEARYYLAENYYRSNQIDQALAYFYQVVEENQTNYTNRSVQRIAELEYSQGNYDRAIDHFQQLARISRNKKEQYNAWSGLMESYYEKTTYDSVDYYANLILEKGAVSAQAENKALLFLGKAAYARENYDQAVDAFLNTLNSAKDISGAEAQYLMAQIFYKQEKYKQAIETLYDLNQNFSVYEEWIGKSFLLIADSYVGLEEYFQAKATLNSLIEKSPLEDIKQQARQQLAELEEQEKLNQPAENDTSVFEQPESSVN
ncbi:MAG: tetratricopeptide repeat protein [Candidatus Cyclobacteriaceae bacterium M3_2C_046]